MSLSPSRRHPVWVTLFLSFSVFFCLFQEPRPFDKQSLRVCIYEWVPAVDQNSPFAAWPMPEMGYVVESPPPGPADQELGPMYLPCTACNVDIVLDNFSRISPLRAAPRALCTVPRFVPVLIGC